MRHKINITCKQVEEILTLAGVSQWIESINVSAQSVLEGIMDQKDKI